jgi:hypothetical protein
VSCILLWLQGGISHIDSFDPKPEAPAEIRGEFGVIGTNVPGIQLCDPLAQLAHHQDKYSILRSLNPRNGSFGVAGAYMMSGHPFNPSVTYPSYGAVVAKEQGDRNAMSPTSSSAVSSIRGSSAAWRGSLGTSATHSCCRAMPRGRISRSGTSFFPAESIAADSSAG